MRFLHDSVIVILFMTLLSEFIDIRLLSLYTGYWCNGEHTVQSIVALYCFFLLVFCVLSIYSWTRWKYAPFSLCVSFILLVRGKPDQDTVSSIMCIIYIISTRGTRPGHRFFNHNHINNCI